MMIKRSEVEHVAKLARLTLSAEEIDQYTGQLDRILEYVHKLEHVETAEVTPTAQPLPLTNVFREDELEESLASEIVLEAAPEREGHYFKTPKILGS